MINDEVDSINLKNAIIQSILPFELPEFAKDIEEMIIEEDFGNDYYGNLVIENYPNLEKIVVKKNSLQNLKVLKICNNDQLKVIEVKNSERYLSSKNICAFVRNVVFEGIEGYNN